MEEGAAGLPPKAARQTAFGAHLLLVCAVALHLSWVPGQHQKLPYLYGAQVLEALGVLLGVPHSRQGALQSARCVYLPAPMLHGLLVPLLLPACCKEHHM